MYYENNGELISYIWQEICMDVDGVGGNVKQLVHQKSMSKEKDRVVVQDAFTFTNEAKKLMKEGRK